MKNLIDLATDVMEVFNIDNDASSVRIYTNDARESIIKLTCKHSVEDKWNDNVEKFLQQHQAVKIFLDGSWVIKAVVPEYYAEITDFNLQPSETVVQDLPGSVKSITVRFDNPITLSDFKFYAVRKELVELEDTDFSASSSSIVSHYNGQRSVSITLEDAGEKSVGVITIIDHR